jgi:hypothetical protein
VTRDMAGVQCNGKDGTCTEVFTISESTSAAEGTTDPSTFDCGDRCTT